MLIGTPRPVPVSSARLLWAQPGSLATPSRKVGRALVQGSSLEKHFQTVRNQNLGNKAPQGSLIGKVVKIANPPFHNLVLPETLHEWQTFWDPLIDKVSPCSNHQLFRIRRLCGSIRIRLGGLRFGSPELLSEALRNCARRTCPIFSSNDLGELGT